MKTLPRFVFAAVITAGAIFGPAQVSRAQSSYAPVAKYDPKRDAAQDIRDAAASAGLPVRSLAGYAA